MTLSDFPGDGLVASCFKCHFSYSSEAVEKFEHTPLGACSDFLTMWFLMELSTAAEMQLFVIATFIVCRLHALLVTYPAVSVIHCLPSCLIH